MAAGSGGLHKKRRLGVRAGFAFIFLLGGASGVPGQTYPIKPIRLVGGFDAGGAADIIARAMSDPLSRALGQGIIVENKPGAGSSLAAALVAKAAPYGYTIMIASQSGMIVNPLINKIVTYATHPGLLAITHGTRPPSV